MGKRAALVRTFAFAERRFGDEEVEEGTLVQNWSHCPADLGPPRIVRLLSDSSTDRIGITQDMDMASVAAKR